jgi:hypothetical protein
MLYYEHMLIIIHRLKYGSKKLKKFGEAHEATSTPSNFCHSEAKQLCHSEPEG